MLKKKPLKNQFKTRLKDKVIELPITPEGFHQLVAHIVKKYSLPNPDHATAIIANLIQRLPPDQFQVNEHYLGHSVLKNIAYQVARSEGSKLQHRAEIDALDAVLKNNPHDQECLDALSQAAHKGSDYAKEVLERYRPDASVIPITTTVTEPRGSAG